MKGRRLPTAMKKAQGTFEQNKSVSNEMIPSRMDGLPSIPDAIAGNKRACELWHPTVATLYDLGLLSVVHLPSVAAYCIEMARYYEAYEIVESEGPVDIAQSGYRMPSPWVGIGNKALDMAMKLGAKFGLYPVDAMKISAPRKSDNDDGMFG